MRNHLATGSFTRSGGLDAPELLDAARGYIAASKSASTRRNYATQWRLFEAWCDTHERAAMPTEPATLALYLTHRARSGRKVATLAIALSAIRAAHRDAALADPAAFPEVRTVWEGIRRTHGAAQRRATPLMAADVQEVHAALAGHTLIGQRNRAMILLGFAAALRRSELVALDVADLTFLRRRGLVVTVRRSKTDQTGVGAEVAVPFGATADTCPVGALRAWIAAAGLTSGPVFRSVDRHGNLGARLDGRDVARIVKQAASHAGLDPTEVSGHSLRAGLATTAALAGKSDRAIMAQGRWRSRSMLDRYVRSADQWRDNAAEGLL